MVQWLRLHTSNAGGVGLIPGQGTKNPFAVQPKKKKKMNIGLKKKTNKQTSCSRTEV